MLGNQTFREVRDLFAVPRRTEITEWSGDMLDEDLIEREDMVVTVTMQGYIKRTPLEAFRKVIVPLAAPGVFTTAIIAFFIAWNDFVFGISLTSTETARTVPAALAFFTGASQFEQPTGAIMAAAVVVTIPVVILVLFFQRRIVAGLTSGAVKG